MTRIAMWSGPRNLSTAMMYSFAARGDCDIWDEPFYAPYLYETGVDHPMRAKILEVHETDPKIVGKRCQRPLTLEKPVFYMKHMPHHMMDGFPMDWARDCVNVHLIRHPARVMASYQAKRAEMTMDDIGFDQQLRIYNALGGIVVDSDDIRENPPEMLQRLCQEIGIDYTERMLSWPAGGRPEDGVWAAHWYGAIHKSTGFAGPDGPFPPVRLKFEHLYQQAKRSYENLALDRIRL